MVIDFCRYGYQLRHSSARVVRFWGSKPMKILIDTLRIFCAYHNLQTQIFQFTINAESQITSCTV